MLSHRSALALLSVLGAAASSTHAAPWIELIPEGFYITDLSYDGTSAAGNITLDGSYETFRWTRLEGVVPLGRSSVVALGVGGGSPDISYNGDRVSATIVSEDNTVATLGVWSIDSDWQEAFQPMPPFVAVQDQNIASAWGLSGDGRYVSGLYLGPSGSVHPCAWSPTLPLIDLPTEPGLRGRANALSYDGSIIGGWEDQGLGPWIPTVWRSGVKHSLIPDSIGSTMVNSINIDGSVVVGYAPDEFFAMLVGAIWTWNGSSYDMQLTGALPETVYSWGMSQLTSVSDNGRMAVGTNRFAFNPGQGGDAIVWTPETGLMSGTDFITSLGLSIPDNIELRDFQSISPDGSVIAAAGIRTDIGGYQSFLIHLYEPCPADINTDRQVDDLDFVSFAGAYNAFDCADPSMPLRCPADLNRDGQVDDADFVSFASAYDAFLCS